MLKMQKINDQLKNRLKYNDEKDAKSNERKSFVETVGLYGA